jgi:hypothetical protein
VATDAVLSQRFFVLVIFGMARVAIRTQLDAVEAPGVAALAPSILVFATQHVLGIRVVVKRCFFPQVGLMAGFTFFTKLPFVTFIGVVIFLVASDAGARGFFVIARFMAVSAFHIGMFSRQGKTRSAMVKTSLFPIGLVVAISAFGA